MYFRLTNGTRKFLLLPPCGWPLIPDLWVRPYITAAAATSWLAPYPDLWVRPYITAAAATSWLAPYPDLWVRPYYITAAAATSWLAPYPDLWVRPYCTVHWRLFKLIASQ